MFADPCKVAPNTEEAARVMAEMSEILNIFYIC
jgi:hypothetical protein